MSDRDEADLVLKPKMLLIFFCLGIDKKICTTLSFFGKYEVTIGRWALKLETQGSSGSVRRQRNSNAGLFLFHTFTISLFTDAMSMPKYIGQRINRWPECNGTIKLNIRKRKGNAACAVCVTRWEKLALEAFCLKAR